MTSLNGNDGGLVIRGLVAASVVVGLAACGGSGSSPTPVPPELRFSSSTDVMFVGATQHFIAALVSGDTSQDVTATFMSSNLQVASVDASGLVTAHTNGTTDITAVYGANNLRAIAPLRVAPDYSGSWNGTFLIRTCGRDAAFPVVNFCSAAAVGSQAIALSLTQTRLTAAGTLLMFGGQGAVTATVDPSGVLIVSGAVVITNGGVPFTVTQADWRTSLVNEMLTGSFSTVWATPGSVGNGFFEAEMADVTRALRTGGLRSN